MPIPVPAGALREAHRVLCVRCLRHMTKHPDHLCEYNESSSKKCGYCTKQKARCVPVSVLNQARICIDNSQIPWFCGPDFAEFALCDNPADTEPVRAPYANSDDEPYNSAEEGGEVDAGGAGDKGN